jgi:hypothetical protein
MKETGHRWHSEVEIQPEVIATQGIVAEDAALPAIRAEYEVDKFDKAGFASAIAGLTVCGFACFLRHHDIESAVEAYLLEGRQVAEDAVDHDATRRMRPR